MMPPRPSRDALIEKRRKIEAQLKALDARDREQQRKDDTRRKIILGGLVMAEIEDDASLRETIRKLIEEKASEKDRGLLADFLASVAATPMTEVAKPQEAQGETPMAQPPQNPTTSEAPKSSLILPGQGAGQGTPKAPDTAPTKPSFIVRP